MSDDDSVSEIKSTTEGSSEVKQPSYTPPPAPQAPSKPESEPAKISTEDKTPDVQKVRTEENEEKSASSLAPGSIVKSMSQDPKSDGSAKTPGTAEKINETEGTDKPEKDLFPKDLQAKLDKLMGPDNTDPKTESKDTEKKQTPSTDDKTPEEKENEKTKETDKAKPQATDDKDKEPRENEADKAKENDKPKTADDNKKTPEEKESGKTKETSDVKPNEKKEDMQEKKDKIVTIKGPDGKPQIGVVTQGDPNNKDSNIKIRTPGGEIKSVPASTAEQSVEKAARKVLDTKLNPEIRESFKENLKNNPTDFPKLGKDSWEAVSGVDKKFNCIANSIHKEDEWVWPGAKVEDFDKLYAEQGLVPLDSLDYSLQEGIEKVVLYGVKPSDGAAYNDMKSMLDEGEEPYNKELIATHAIYQESDGTFSSKMGANERIRILSPDDLGGGLYGNPIRVYGRIRPK